MTYTRALLDRARDRWPLTAEQTYAGAILVLFAILLLLIFSAQSYGQASWKDDSVQQFAKQTEAKYCLPHGICHAMNVQENSGKLTNASSRVEAGFYNVGERHYSLVFNSTAKFFEQNPDIDLPFDVERYQQATSWGPWQLMGFNLRDLGCTTKYLAQVSLSEHFDYWGMFFARLWKQAKRNLARALKYYNGPSIKRSYIDHVTRDLAKFSY